MSTNPLQKSPTLFFALHQMTFPSANMAHLGLPDYLPVRGKWLNQIKKDPKPGKWAYGGGGKSDTQDPKEVGDLDKSNKTRFNLENGRW